MKISDKIKERRESKIIIVVDKDSQYDSIEAYTLLTKLINSISDFKYKLTCDFNKDYYRIDLTNIPDTMTKIKEINEKLLDKNLILVNGGIRNEIWTYYEKVEPYFELMARSAGKFINVSPYIEMIVQLSKD